MHFSWKSPVNAMFALLTTLLLLSCGGSEGAVTIQSDCSTEGQNRTLYSIMKDAYLWYEEVPDLDPVPYQDIEILLEDLKYKKYDKWSYITTQSNYDSYFNSGKYIGFGFSLGFDGSQAYFKLVFEGSPAWLAGLRRGIEVLEINDKTVQEIDAAHLWDSIYGIRKIGIEGHFKIRTADGRVRELTLRKEEVTSYSILYDKIWDVGGEKVGYFVFNKFIEPSRAELAAQFRKFKAAGITRLILDLRYNGGGRVHIARYLAGLISGAQHVGEVLASLKHNDRYTHWDKTYRLKNEIDALGLSSLTVITTASSCSASEMLINGLKPFLDIKVIGERTCGKPVGMHGYSFCDRHFAPIQYKVFNAEAVGDYYEGLPADCRVSDDLRHDFGAEDEAMLQEALHLMQYDRCSSATAEKRSKRMSTAVEISREPKGWDREVGAI